MTSKFEMEGREHLEESSMGGDGGGCGYAYGAPDCMVYKVAAILN
jgi:hypothetical protein